MHRAHLNDEMGDALAMDQIAWLDVVHIFARRRLRLHPDGKVPDPKQKLRWL